MSEQVIVLSEIDYARLNNLELAEAETLEEILERAAITSDAQISPDLVTMNSVVSYQRLSDNKIIELTVVYPHEADLSQHFISVLSPIGQALLGRKKGDVVNCALPGGEISQLKILEIIYQPERDGGD